MFNEKGQEIVNIDEVISLKHLDTGRIFNRISDNRFQYFDRESDANEDGSYNALNTTSIVVSADLMKKEILDKPEAWNILEITDEAKERLEIEFYKDCNKVYVPYNDLYEECEKFKTDCIQAQANELETAIKYRLLTTRINNLLSIYKSRRDLAYAENSTEGETIDLMINLLESLSK